MNAVQVAFQGRAVLPPPVGLYQNAWPIGLDLGQFLRADVVHEFHGDAAAIFQRTAGMTTLCV